MASEIDKYARKAYEIVFGETPRGDVTKIDAADVPDHDLLVAGFPCQAFSVAGKRLGFEDTRGALFFEIVRIAKEKRPKVLLLENVKGLVGHNKGKTIETIILVLNDIGYTDDFQVLNSKYFGVPQNRERVFFVCIRDDLVEREPWAIDGNNVVAKAKKRLSQINGIKTLNFDWPEQSQVTTRIRDILETEVDEKYYLSDERTAALLAQLEEKDKIVGTVGHHPFSKKYEFNGYNSEISPSLIATDYKAPKTVLEAEPQIDVVGNLKPEGATREDGEESFTLTSQDRHGVALGNPPKYGIRKLTPLEYWRLQGFPDEAHERVKLAGISDSQRYKQAGNAVTVNVIEAIGRRLLPWLEGSNELS